MTDHHPWCALRSMTLDQQYVAGLLHPTLGCTCGAITVEHAAGIRLMDWYDEEEAQA